METIIMKNKILKEIDSFVALLYTFGKINAADGVKKFFTDMVNQAWDSNKDDETNLKEIKSLFNINKEINKFHNNSDLVTCIDIFMSDYLLKI